MTYLYKNWAKFSIFIGFILFAYLFSNPTSPPIFWIWVQFPIYLVHEFEEHVWPGHFKSFINREIFHSKQLDRPLSDAGVFWINILVIWVLFPLAGLFAQTGDLRIGIFLPYFSLLNATTHIAALFMKRKYNPGLFSSLFLNYPAGIYALFILSKNQVLTWTNSLICVGICFLIHLCIVIFVLSLAKNIKRS